MLRLSFRFAGLVLLALAFAALLVDGTRSVAAGTPAILPLGRTVSALFPDLFVTLRAGIETQVPLIWDPVLVTLLLLPSWLVLGLAGFGVLAVTRRSAPTIGYVRR